jgi:putative endonuclease
MKEMNPVRAFHYVYVLQNIYGDFYTGCTSDLKKRYSEHMNGLSKYTKSRGPYKLIYYEACLDKNDAFRREKYLKTGMGKRYIKNRLKVNLEALTG